MSINNSKTLLNSTDDNDFALVSDDEFTSNIFVQFIICLFYLTFFVLGIFGNVLVCFVVARNSQMHTVTNLFITNLAVSDILLCILAVPFTPLYTFLGRWVFGESLCHLVPYAQGVSIYISTLTLTSIAVDRFLVIIYPFHPRMKIKCCLSVIIGIWIVALFLTLPYGIYMTLEEPNFYCEEHWPSQRFRVIFSLVTSILQFVVPFFVITFCYICVSIRLNDRAKSKPGSKTSRREEADRERKRRTNFMLIAMVTIFGVCWLPLNIVNIVDDSYASLIHWSYYRLCFFITHCLAMSSTCYNPLLYAWLNENFRKEFKQVLPCFSRFSASFTPRTTEAFRSEKLYNDNDATQGNLPSLTVKSNPDLLGECIPLELKPGSTFQATSHVINESTDVEDVLL
ncbi:prolactin-releasing peptide receptor-like [Chelonus insularis]|uniref:prolactin-releasing peptide receptor-like n=1 Tax=Chelonus insularis TaxID=460826 RepID=UPI00158A915A|nr:prolactin-releasing peptide receptor-like [Chelonus insularis]